MQWCTLSSCSNERNDMIVLASSLVAWIYGSLEELPCPAALLLAAILSSALSLTDDHNADH